MIKLAYFWRKGLWALMSLFFLILIIMGFTYVYLEKELPSVESLKTVRLQVPLRIYSQEGELIQEYGEKRRIPIAYNDIPPMLIKALLVTEDQRFFDHSGVDLLGLSRAALRMLKTGTKSQGGSTITMQVARNFFLSRKKTFLRKFNEILLAIKIDKEFSKETILELYLNRIYLGNRAYGVAAAAYTYYGKPLAKLSLAELAMLAGLPQAPSTQNPLINPIAAKKRRDHVLSRLLEEKYITNIEYEEAIHQPVAVAYHTTQIQVPAPYAAEMIRQSLYERFGPKAYTQGYEVYTTIKAPLQHAANEIIVNHLLAYDHRHGYRGAVTNLTQTPSPILLRKFSAYAALEPGLIVEVLPKTAKVMRKNGQIVILPWDGLAWAKPALKRGGWVGKSPQQANQILHKGDVVYITQYKDHWILTQLPQAEAALIALNPNNGAIEALVGGFNFEKSKFNRAVQSSRQPGSSFKPFIYAAALHKDYTLATLINDAPITVEDPSQAELWRPHNVNLNFKGPTRLKEALIHSSNMVSIRVLDDLGFDYAINFLTHFGFQKKQLPHALSLALGSLSVSPLELTAAYAVFANGGFKIEPYLIDHIQDPQGSILLQAKPSIVCNGCNMENADPATLAPQVIPSDIAFLINSALKDVIQKGTASAAAALHRSDLAGKTGTTNDQVDAWFSGYNSDLVTTVWVGYDNPQSLHEYAATLALPIWIDFMRLALKNKPLSTLAQPKSVVSALIDPNTGELAKANQKNAILEYFRIADLPEEDLDEEENIMEEGLPPE